MDKYQVKLMPKTFRDLDHIYKYIAHEIREPETAEHLLKEIEQAVFDLEMMPERGSPRNVGAHVNQGYRQIFVGNFTIVYRVDKKRKLVIVVTVRYTPSQF